MRRGVGENVSNCGTLHFTGKSTATLFSWVPDGEGELVLRGNFLTRIKFPVNNPILYGLLNLVVDRYYGAHCSSFLLMGNLIVISAATYEIQSGPNHLIK